MKKNNKPRNIITPTQIKLFACVKSRSKNAPLSHAAKKCDIDVTRFWRMAHGMIEMKLSELEKICDAYEINLPLDLQ
jgi:hypothetical protein